MILGNDLDIPQVTVFGDIFISLKMVEISSVFEVNECNDKYFQKKTNPHEQSTHVLLRKRPMSLVLLITSKTGDLSLRCALFFFLILYGRMHVINNIPPK